MADLPKLRLKTPEELEETRRKLAAQQVIRTATHSVCDKLDPARRQLILTNAIGGDFDCLLQTVDPIEIHLFASNWNCDRGVFPLLQIARHRNCDAGTALWLYWENDPYFYLPFRALEDANNAEEGMILAMMRTIEQRITTEDFATSIIPFDPKPWIEGKYDNATWAMHVIPDAMYRALPEKIT